MTLCNVALILAADGYRVLVVDVTTGEPGVSAFLQQYTPPGEIGTGRAVSLALSLSGGIHVRRVVWQSDACHASTLRAECAAYDYVLVDVPRSTADDVRSFTAALCDSVVLCFPPTPRALEEAGEELTWFERASVGRIVPVLMRVDPSAGDGLAEVRQVAKSRFGIAGACLEIPYRAEYSASEGLAVLLEPPGAPQELRAAYERLASSLTGSESLATRQITIVYASRRRIWAEWLGALCARYGVSTQLVAQYKIGRAPIPVDQQVLVIHSDDLDAMAVRQFGEQGTVLVRTDDEPVPAELARLPALDLHQTEEKDAPALLASVLGLGPLPLLVDSEGGPPRYPSAAQPPIGLTLDHRFEGRDELLEELRVALAPASSCYVALSGPGGIGKTQSALEFVQRFHSSYDVVVWINAMQYLGFRTGLTRLAKRLKLHTFVDLQEAVSQELASGTGRRWLVVCDGVRDPEELMRALPLPEAATGSVGHVLVTGRTAQWPEPFHTISIDAMSLADAVSLLRTRLATLTDRAAQRVAETVERLPLALDLAGAWLAARSRQSTGRARDSMSAPVGTGEAEERIVEDFIEHFEERRLQHIARYGQQPSVYHTLADLALLELADGPAGAAGVWLVEVFAFLSSRGVQPALLRSPHMTVEMQKVDRRLAEASFVDVALREADRYGLIRAELGRAEERIRMQPILRETVTERLGLQGTLELRRLEVARVLARTAPRYMENMDADTKGVFEELDRHLGTLNVLAAPMPEDVWRWALAQLKFRLLDNHHDSVRRVLRHAEVGRRVLESEDGRRMLGASESELHAELRAELLLIQARAHLRLGQGRRTVELGSAALEELVRVHGPLHPVVLEGTGAVAYGLRSTGDFELSYDKSASALQGLRKLFGANHPAVGRAMNNHALAAGLMGHYTEAVRLAEERIARRSRLHDDNDPFVLGTACNLAYFLRELGEHENARVRLLDVLKRLQYVSDPAHTERISARLGLHVIKRRMGGVDDLVLEGRRLLTEAILAFGESGALTLCCEVSLGADLFAVGRYPDAVAHAGQALGHLQEELGADHPFTQVCRGNLGVYLRMVDQIEEAFEHGFVAVRTLLDKVGDLHPLYLAVAANHSGTLVQLDRREEAFELENDILDGLTLVYGDGHPRTEAVAINLDVTRLRQEDNRQVIDIEIPG
ncbi:hypothetical protein GCM10023334_111630 [Nonomuraea thailandensis]